MFPSLRQKRCRPSTRRLESPRLEALEDRLLLSASPLPQTCLPSTTQAPTPTCPTTQTCAPNHQGLAGLLTRLLVCADVRGGSQQCASNQAPAGNTGRNRPPETEADFASTPTGQAVVVDVLRNDHDPEGKPLSIPEFTQGVNGGVERGPSTGNRQQLRYTPRAGYQGLDFFHYTAADKKGLTAREVAYVQVGDWVAPASWPCVTGSSPLPPQAVNDYATTTVGKAVSINVLSNDRDPDGGGLVLLGFVQPKNGTVKFDPARPGVVIYQPKAGFQGEDTFEYTISDGKPHTAKGTVKVKVNPLPATNPGPAQPPPANRPPVAVDDRATGRPGKPVTVNVLGNDRDPDGDALTIVSAGAPARGTVRIEGNKVVYTPTGLFTGTDRFTYKVRDAKGAEASATVTVELTNRPPVTQTDQACLKVNETVGVCVLTNDCDPDGDVLQVVSFSATTARGGQVRRDPSNSNRLLYTPPTGYAGEDSFCYVAGDGMGGATEGRVTLVVSLPRCGTPPPIICTSGGGGLLNLIAGAIDRLSCRR